jgi:hypothetical protein
VLGGGQADAHVGAERAGDLAPQPGSHRGAGDPPDHLADHEAERVDVIAMPAPRSPPGFLPGQPGRARRE